MYNLAYIHIYIYVKFYCGYFFDLSNSLDAFSICKYKWIFFFLKAVEVAGNYDGESNDGLRNGKMKAFLSLARFSDTQYQRIENYMKSSEFENKQALLKRAKEEVGLLREHKIQTNR